MPFVAISPLLLGSLVRYHFDLWPTLLVVAAITALLRDRHRIGWAMIGAAFAAKLFAAVLVPLALVWTLRRRGKNELARVLAVCISVVAIAFVPFAALAPHGLASAIRGQITRPLQIETLAASFLMTFEHPQIMSSHGSKSLPNHNGLATATTILMLALLLALWIGFVRGPMEPERFTRYAAACVCVFVAFGKILSPQFLVWLVPLVPLTQGRRGLAATGLLTAALINTQVWFPGRYFNDYVYVPNLAWLVLVRNLLLVAVFVVLAAPSLVSSAGGSRLRNETPVELPARADAVSHVATEILEAVVGRRLVEAGCRRPGQALEVVHDPNQRVVARAAVVAIELHQSEPERPAGAEGKQGDPGSPNRRTNSAVPTRKKGKSAVKKRCENEPPPSQCAPQKRESRAARRRTHQA